MSHEEMNISRIRTKQDIVLLSNDGSWYSLYSNHIWLSHQQMWSQPLIPLQFVG